MSNLLNAIAQSEQQHQNQSSQPNRPAMNSTQPRRLTSWLLPAMLVVAPVAGTLAYTQLTVSAATSDTVSIPSTVPAVEISPPSTGKLLGAADPVLTTPKGDEVLVLGEGESAIRFLPYPDLRAEPLPSLSSQFASRLRESAASSSASLTAITATEPIQVSSKPQVEAEWGLEGLDYSELSPQLAEQLKSAIAATDSLPLDEPPEQETSPEPVIQAIALGELPASVQNRIPPLDFQTHIYSSTADSRWVKVNGREAFEGDEIAPGVTLRRIEPRQVVFDFESYLVEMPALSEW
ncbi:general secretion pathway protein GspB [Photobacterium sp. SDRW27]|uniref:general secretion pathway protein GspB n=1 Tax=Photobacterium obscurum TaxID=2829490 RepID=UPI00224455F4|nr:general secretion pathway protein GspB [Photobacterium obscurum]MCW8330346.1 general secretion pathway protein GspB [Photobacterium obscurum]